MALGKLWTPKSIDRFCWRHGLLSEEAPTMGMDLTGTSSDASRGGLAIGNHSKGGFDARQLEELILRMIVNNG